MLACCVFALSAFGADPSGSYALEGVREVASELLLDASGKFRYMFAYGAADYFAEGTWKLDGNSVVLTSRLVDVPPIRAVRSGAAQRDEFRVVVKTAQGRGIPHIRVMVTSAAGEATEPTDSDGEALFPKQQGVKSITFEIRVYQFVSEAFPVKAGDNDFLFELNGEALTQVPFKDERLKVNGDVLEMRFWDKDKVMRYRKQ